MSTSSEKYKGNPVQVLLFLAILAVGAYAFQTMIIKPLFRNMMVTLFAPEEMHGHVEDKMYSKEFLLDVSDQDRTVEKDQYTKPAGEWVVRAEKLGEDAIKIQPWVTFGIFSIFFGFILATVVSSILPRQIGYMSNKIEREINNTIDRIDEQTGDKVTREEIERITASSSKDDLSPIAK
jgi:hypothetical protein